MKINYKNFTVHLNFKTGKYHAFNFCTFQTAGPAATLEEIKKEIDLKKSPSAPARKTQ